MLDAVERSIETPAAFQDPLVQQPLPPIDGVGRMLGALEASIEYPLATALDARIAQELLQPSLPVDDVGQDDLLAAAEEVGAKAKVPDPVSERTAAPQALPEGPSRQVPQPAPRDLSAGHRVGASRGSSEPRHSGYSPRGRAGTGATSNHLYCPESRESVDPQECKSCDKYRRWPEGTQEEPMECWHDWETRRALREAEEDLREEE
jgi:hypothetical protein